MLSHLLIEEVCNELDLYLRQTATKAGWYGIDQTYWVKFDSNWVKLYHIGSVSS